MINFPSGNRVVTGVIKTDLKLNGNIYFKSDVFTGIGKIENNQPIILDMIGRL